MMKMSKITQICKKIKIVISDVDGVLTDGGVYYSEKGESLKKFNVKDGMGVELLHNKNIKVILLTRENSKIVQMRGEKINADKIILGIKNKFDELEKLKQEFNVNSKEIGYIGDDLNDLEIMSSVGFAGTPFDGHEKIKEVSDYICEKRGGHGAFREFAEIIIENGNKNE